MRKMTLQAEATINKDTKNDLSLYFTIPDIFVNEYVRYNINYYKDVLEESYSNKEIFDLLNKRLSYKLEDLLLLATNDNHTKEIVSEIIELLKK